MRPSEIQLAEGLCRAGERVNKSMDHAQSYVNRFIGNTKTEGKMTKYFLDRKYAEGTIVRCELTAGIEMAFFDYRVESGQTLSGFDKENILEIFYCLSGNIGLVYPGQTVQLKDNRIGIYDFNACPQKVVLEQGRVKGISLLLDVNLADRAIKKHFSQNTLTMEQLRERITEHQHLFLAFGNQALRSVFLGIAENPFDYDMEYLLLKALELILISIKSMQQERQGSYRSKIKTRQRMLYEKAVGYMESHMAAPLTVAEIAGVIGVTGRQLNQYFLDNCRRTVYAYLKELRLQKAAQLLAETELPVTEISGQLGWQNPSKFSAAFKQRYGITPMEFRIEN